MLACFREIRPECVSHSFPLDYLQASAACLWAIFAAAYVLASCSFVNLNRRNCFKRHALAGEARDSQPQFAAVIARGRPLRPIAAMGQPRRDGLAAMLGMAANSAAGPAHFRRLIAAG